MIPIQCNIEEDYYEQTWNFHELLGEDDDGQMTMMVSGEDYLDDQVRKAYYAPDESEETGHRGDIMWYLWLSEDSPLFGKDKMATFERYFLAEKETHKENMRLLLMKPTQLSVMKRLKI